MLESKSIFSILLILSCLSGICQNNPDKINLMNGQTIEGTIIDTTDGKVLVKAQLKSKTKEYMFDHYRVYSIEKKDLPEFIFYKRDTTIGNYLTQNEMKFYFLGEKDARKNYNPIGVKVTSALFAFGISLVDTYRKDSLNPSFMNGFFKSEPGLASLVAPFAITALASFPAVQISINKVSNKNYLNEQSYVDGFEKVGRSKKVFGALKFSLIGGAAGILSYFIFK
jgi:hypothetical protein